jgi:toxin HigB-1
VIKSFKDTEAERLFKREPSRKIPSALQRVALRKLRMLNQANTLEDLRIPPENRLEALKADREGQYSIRINNRWRICFIWEDKNAYEVEITDYH